MKNFNTTDIFAGYIKQKLHDFNLPKIKVYTNDHKQYHDMAVLHNKRFPTEPAMPEERFDILGSILPSKGSFDINTGTDYDYPNNMRHFQYIKDGKIQEYIRNADGISGTWQDVGFRNSISGSHTHVYSFGIKVLNYTKNLKINNNIYDSYTHEYLGDYLRFIRDYKGINLMSMYNCYSNTSCERLYIKENNFIFDASDDNYKICMLPVKLFQAYTIAIDSDYPIELCCGLYGQYQDTRDKFKSIPSLTYQFIAKSKFSQPILYDKLLSEINRAALLDDLVELAQNECDLKLFIKLPKNNTSTIIVLEGDYREWNSATHYSTDNITGNAAYKTEFNKTVINFEYELEENEIALISPIQLLRLNTGEQHPFSDRLIEYLLENAITSDEDEISHNVKRVQKVLELNYHQNKYSKTIAGIWEPRMTLLLYDYMTNYHNNYDVNHDLTGYVDKDTEKYYTGYKYYMDDGKLVSEPTSILNAELEEDD